MVLVPRPEKKEKKDEFSPFLLSLSLSLSLSM
jgi:hypothetical protein